MPIAQEGGDPSLLEELIVQLKSPSSPNPYRNALQKGVAGLDVSTLAERHRTFASAIFPLLLAEESALSMANVPATGLSNNLKILHRRMRVSLEALFPTVPSKENSARRRNATESLIQVLRDSITTSVGRITKPGVKDQFLSIANTDIPEDDADAQWFAVMLSLLSYQAADAMLMSQKDQLAAELEESLTRVKRLNLLIAELFPKPGLGNELDVALRNTTPVIKI